jgi:hypothetical protein
MGLSESAKGRKCRQEEKSSYHILCQCSTLAKHRLEIFCFAWLELIDFRRASVSFVLAVALQLGLFERP